MSARDKYRPILAEELRGKIQWLINLRWIASICLLAVITIAALALRTELPVLPLYIGNAVLILYNSICLLVNLRLRKRENQLSWYQSAYRFANVQILIDLILLTYLIHFSGGLENPFISFYLFHMIISSILLSNRAAYFQATFAVLLFTVAIGGEHLGLLPHHHLGLIAAESCNLALTVFSWRLAVFALTLYITIYMTTYIVNRLRKSQAELTSSNKKLEEQYQLKSKYVMMVSHDIQGSLGAIQGYLKVLLDGLAGEIPDKVREIISAAENRGVILLRFVRDLLNLSKMRSFSDMEKKEIDLKAIIQTCYDMLKQKIAEKKIDFSLEYKVEDGRILGDPQSINQVFENLLGNAVKYTDQGGRIVLSVEDSDNPDFIAITVKDNGIGIPPENLPHIYDDFFRAENAKASREQGTGLGLSIVQTAVAMHGGKISVESELHKGTIFRFTFRRLNDPGDKIESPTKDLNADKEAAVDFSEKNS